MSYKKRVLLLILLFSLIRLVLAYTMELGTDETYYWLYTQYLKWNYFDHPPMVAVWERIFNANLLLPQSEGFVRLASIVGCALSSWFMYKAVSLLHSEKAGWFAVCLYNASFYAGIVAGIFIMPDSPQMVFWTLSLWMIARISIEEDSWMNWILFGIVAGLCIMSKVHGVFIWVGMGLFILTKKRSWLALPQLYTALIISLIITSPILIWNIQHDFITYRFQSDRVKIHDSVLNPGSFFSELMGQLFFNNPFNVALILIGFTTWRSQKTPRLTALSIYNFIGLPMALLLLFISLFRDTTLPHWSGPAYVSLLPLAAIALANRSSKQVYPALIKWTVIMSVCFMAGWQVFQYNYPGTFGKTNKADLGYGDVTIDKYGWREGGKAFAEIYSNNLDKGIIPRGTPMVCNKWWGAHLEYYFCRPTGIVMIGLGPMINLHEYTWINSKRKDLVNFNTAYCIVPSNESYDPKEQYAPYYEHIDSVTSILIKRKNIPVLNFTVYRLTGWKNNLPLAINSPSSHNKVNDKWNRICWYKITVPESDISLSPKAVLTK